ncbi:hypothetical protein PROFUN_06666 [Planoprotostelium fungivorum]|uniref:Uncharacterized protein n=1 Tax=Planoprotostelium fungivorum TaxID=1890364 RepID=A0A2P6MSX5_9EUKA|nr:hypothetical protein PROFUN_06666 [Planoprotostelium fungivorum]
MIWRTLAIIFFVCFIFTLQLSMTGLEDCSNGNIHVVSPNRVQPIRTTSSPVSGYEMKEYQLGDDLKRFSLQNQNMSEPESPTLLFSVIVNDEKSWARFNKTTRRTFNHLLDMIKDTKYPASSSSLAVLVSNQTEYESIKQMCTRRANELGFRRINVIHPLASYDVSVSTQDRHKPKYQRQRRSVLAKLRNILMSTTMEDESALLWLDADIFHIDTGLVQEMVKHGREKQIITASCRQGKNKDYDLNAWRGNRTTPTSEQLALIRDGGFYEPRDIKGQVLHFKHLRGGDDIVPLDSVGGTILYIRTSLVRAGVIFPPLYIVGTLWDLKEGWDGIETEGICYIARAIGQSCWGMPNLFVHHTTLRG